MQEVRDACTDNASTLITYSNAGVAISLYVIRSVWIFELWDHRGIGARTPPSRLHTPIHHKLVRAL